MMKCGIVDVGSNTIQLAVYRYGAGEFASLFNQWETVGLAGYVKDGILSPDGVAAACRTLVRFRTLLDNLEITNIQYFATASLRNISNSAQALADILARTGIAVKLLSGAEEADLSFHGAMLGNPAPTGLMTDIGGGSTELVAYGGGAPTWSVSLPFGVVSLFSRFSTGLFPTAAEQAEMATPVTAGLGGVESATYRNLLGVGGTIRAVVGLCNTISGINPDNRVVPARQAEELYTILATADRAALQLILKVAPDRVHTVLPGLIILREIIRRYGVETLTMSTTGVREGYLVRKVMGA